jgi:hypothetical protein
VTIDATAPVTDLDARDLPCVRCGYSLMGHDEHGRCPECGLPAYWSLRAPQKLSQYPATWVRRMSWATRLLFVTYFGAAVTLLCGFFGVISATRIYVFYLFSAATVLQLLGMWAMSASSGHWSEPAAPFNRLILRLAPIGPLLAGLGAIALHVRHSNLLLSLTVFTLLLGIPAPAAVFVRLRAIARLVADAGLAEQSAIVGWGFLFTLTALPLVELYIYLTRANDMTGVPFFAALVIVTALLLFLLWGAFIMLRCVVVFGRAAKVARAEWRTRGGGDGGA